MGYVMVPVPEEHVEEAMAMVLRIVTRARLSPWDQETLNAFFMELDEPSRSVLSAAAKAVVAGAPMAERALADSIELPPREVLAIVREINEQVTALEREQFVVLQKDTQVLPNGRTQEQRLVWIESAAAPMILEAEKADLAANPHPLLGDSG